MGPAPEWLADYTYDAAIPAKEGWHATQLLWMRQVHAELGESFHASAVRLETPVAVQHQSQWKLNFDARHQEITIHWLRVVRHGTARDQLSRDRMRLIQRETELDRHVISGNWTLLVIFDDVRPGDIIDTAYSVRGRSPIRPEGCEVFFVVPPQAVVGRFHVSVQFSDARPTLNHRTSSDAPPCREEVVPNELRRWTWEGEQLEPREAEQNQPSSFLDFIWIEVSDLVEWNAFAARVRQAWNEASGESPLNELPGFTRPEVVDEAAVNALIQQVQDEFRYLSMDLETGGWIPASPAVVAERRYGDCKDLTWMTASILRGWGVAATPLLVGSGLCEQVGAHLPAAFLFDHAVLEVALAGQRRWFDLTLRNQGGTFAKRFVGRFGLGLPVSLDATGLVEQPNTAENNLYVVRETILIETRRGLPCTIEQRIWLEGWYADNMRQQRNALGAEDFAAHRLQLAQNRMQRKVQRVGALHWRDNRGENTCELVDVFDIHDAVYPDETGNRALFDVPPNIFHTSLLVPPEKPRRGPWALPFPVEMRHQIVAMSPSMHSGERQRRRWSEREFTATEDQPRVAGDWTKTMRLQTHESIVPPDRVAAFGATLNAFLIATTWRLYLPWNQPKPTRPTGFGELPSPAIGVRAYVLPADPKTFPVATETTSARPIAHTGGGRRSNRALVVSGVLVVAAFLQFVSSSSSLWEDEPFRERPRATVAHASTRSTEPLRAAGNTNLVAGYPDPPVYSGNPADAARFRTRASAYLRQIQADLRQIRAKASAALKSGTKGLVIDNVDTDRKPLEPSSLTDVNASLPFGAGYYPDFATFSIDHRPLPQPSTAATDDIPAIIARAKADPLAQYIVNCQNDRRLLEAKLQRFRRYLQDLGAQNPSLRMLDL